MGPGEILIGLALLKAFTDKGSSAAPPAAPPPVPRRDLGDAGAGGLTDQLVKTGVGLGSTLLAAGVAKVATLVGGVGAGSGTAAGGAGAGGGAAAGGAGTGGAAAGGTAGSIAPAPLTGAALVIASAAAAIIIDVWIVLVISAAIIGLDYDKQGHQRANWGLGGLKQFLTKGFRTREQDMLLVALDHLNETVTTSYEYGWGQYIDGTSLGDSPTMRELVKLARYFACDYYTAYNASLSSYVLGIHYFNSEAQAAQYGWALNPTDMRALIDDWYADDQVTKEITNFWNADVGTFEQGAAAVGALKGGARAVAVGRFMARIAATEVVYASNGSILDPKELQAGEDWMSGVNRLYGFGGRIVHLGGSLNIVDEFIVDDAARRAVRRMTQDFRLEPQIWGVFPWGLGPIGPGLSPEDYP